MSIKWWLAHGKDEDKEVEEPGPGDEIVILKVQELNFGPDMEITFARVGDPLLEPDMMEIVAMAVYYKRAEQSNQEVPAWIYAPREERQLYMDVAGAVLGNLTEHIKEKREARGES